MPEYLEFRCCMCPNQADKPENPMCPTGRPCRFVKTYVDERGWKYRVMPGLGEGNYKARYQKPDKQGDFGWKCVRILPWRNSFDEAQSDLNIYAKQKRWREN